MTVVWQGQTEVPLAPGFVPAACNGFLEPILLDGYLTQPGYMSGPCSFLGAMFFGGWWREWKEERESELGLVCKMKKDSLVSFLKDKKRCR